MQRFILLAFLLSSCCPVNRLPGRGQKIRTVAYEVSAVERPTVRLIGHRSLEIRPELRPVGMWGHTETELEQSLATLGGEDFSALVLKRAAARLGARQGWEPGEGGAGTDALMQIRVENICFCAQDALAEVEVKIALRAVLIASADAELLWRDCLDWSFSGFHQNLQQLGQVDAAQREELLSDLAEQLLDRLAKHLAKRLREE